MDARLARDLNQLPDLLDGLRKHAVDVLDGLAARPVMTVAPIPQPTPMPEHGIGLARTLDEFAKAWEPAFSTIAGPRYLGFVTGGVTPAALAGDWLTSVWDQNSVVALDGAGQQLERRTIGWLRELFGLDASYRGAFVGGATASNTVGLAIAREWVGERLGVSVAEDGLVALGPVRVLSGTPHVSIVKALSVLGLGRRRLVSIATAPGRESVDLGALERGLAQVGGPCVVVANAGTVNTADFDDLAAIAELKRRHEFWLHVDAAFGGFAALSPRCAGLLDGIDRADSICVDMHKWLNVPYGSAVQFTRHPDLQARVYRSSAAYLGPDEGTPDLIHLTPDTSRRLCAVATWFTLRAYGRAGYREIVERCVDNAHELGRAVEATDGLRLLAPVWLNVVCFTLSRDPTASRLADLAAACAGEVFLTPTVHHGIPALRAAFVNWRTTDADVRRVVTTLRAAVQGM